MHSESGTSLVELMVVVAVAALVFGMTAGYAVPMLGREALRSAVYNVQEQAQLARMEAVRLNRDCRLLVDETSRTFSVLDTMGTASLLDDAVLHAYALPSAVEFGHPGGLAPFTIDAVLGPWYQVVYTGEGTVAAGAGEIYVRGGDRFYRVVVLGAGAAQIERWEGHSWEAH